ncbi:MAG: PDGLE domain-containing protein [Chroococcidiopsidaceae cyanobacterium CP_BM_ER_R8_30]|nr:PDGLE domain-containing protein [Chroococcidiopsidaceae cyanobacterium CP_BM_ER_R8_30]
MSHDDISRTRNRALLVTGLGIALLVAIFLSPFASQSPDGLDRVAKDQGFNKKEQEETPAKKLPFYAVFDSYALRFVPGYDKEGGISSKVATSLAGVAGTLATFGLAWGIGKLAVRGSSSSPRGNDPYSEDSERRP